MSAFYKKRAAAGLNLAEAVEIVEGLPVEDQRILLDALRKKSRPAKGTETLVKCGLLSASGAASVCPSDGVLGCQRRLVTYLKRKFEDDEYFDPDLGEMVPCPYGAEYVAAIVVGGEAGGGWAFPDDDVTALLDRFGVNRCRGWKP